MVDARPLYLRGIDRAKAESHARLFMGRYQPPIDCAHRPGRIFKRVDGVQGLFRSCEHCGQVVGVVR